MEYTIENVYVDSEHLLRQAYGHILRKRQILLTVTSAILGVLFAFAWIVLERTIWLLLAVVYVALAVWYWFVPYRTAKKVYKKMLKIHDGDIPPTTVRFGEKIFFDAGTSTSEMAYKKLKSVVFCNDCILIQNEVGEAYLVANDGFTKGSKQELIAFLKEKCPQLKLPDWQWQ